jgi:hypothetical protein
VVALHDPQLTPPAGSLSGTSTGLPAETPPGSTPARPAEQASEDLLPDPTIVVVGCHGGAGTSTVARLLTAAVDAGRTVPARTQLPVVLVAHGTPHGARRATEALAALREQGLQPCGLVIVGDGPWPEPRLSRARIQLLGDLVPAVVRVPYVARWRYLDDPPTQQVPVKVTRALQQIRAAAHPIPSGGI